jgi:hypothetical protein
MRVLQLFALVSTFAAYVESTPMPIFHITVTCDVHEQTVNRSDCDSQFNGGTVWDEISGILMECTWDVMNEPEEDYPDFVAGWEVYTPHARRILLEQQERQLHTCSRTCYSPGSSCCLLDCSLCAGNCSNCQCSRRLGNEEDNIENFLANNRNDEVSNDIVDHAPRRLPDNDNLGQCEVAIDDLRDLLLAQSTPNLCLGEGPATQTKSDAAVKCQKHIFTQTPKHVFTQTP